MQLIEAHQNPARSTTMQTRTVLVFSALSTALFALAPGAQAAPGARACTSADVKLSAGPAGAWRGQATQEIRIANAGSETCHLPGFPGVQLQPSNEAPQTVGASDQAPQLASTRIELAPGQEAIVLLGTPGSCEAANRPERKVAKRLQLALPGGGTKVLDGVYVDTLCGRATVMRFEQVQSENAARALAMKAAGAISQLSAGLSAADEARRGGLLRYTVTLSNPTASPISLSACPAYTQSLYVDGKSSDTRMRLDCGAAGGQIPAKGRVSFEMQAQIPAGAADSAKLSWKLDGGPGVGKIVALH
jgi:hypothetical protein